MSSEHPYYSDQENEINNLRAINQQLKKDAKEWMEKAELLQEKFNKRRSRRISSALRWSALIGLLCGLITGGAFGGYKWWKYEDTLGERCDKLCRMALGDLVVFGNEETVDSSCGDTSRHCICKTRNGRSVRLPVTSKHELYGDINKIKSRLNVGIWNKCNELHQGQSENPCNYVPWKNHDNRQLHR